jgi:dipeptidase E
LRLYLSSYRLGNRPERLAALAGMESPGVSSRRALVIANACDLLAEADRGPRVGREISALESLGFHAEELDLRGYFRNGGERGTPDILDALRAKMASVGLVWARGGNAFVLLRAMRQSGFAEALRDALAADSLVYGGYSGGIAVLAPTLRGIETVNDPIAVPAGYPPATPWDGLGILPYSLAPHYRSAHPASPGIDGVVRYYEAARMPYRVLRDGEARIISGDRDELVS